MGIKQDRAAPRTAADLERKYNFGRTFAELFGLGVDAQKSIEEITGITVSLREDVDSITASVTAIDGTVSSLKVGLGNITTRVSDAEDNISSINQTSSRISSRVSSVETDLEGAQRTLETCFEQTSSGFRLTGNVSISGDLITSGTIAADRIATNISQVNRTLNIGDDIDEQKTLSFNHAAKITTFSEGIGGHYCLKISALKLRLPSIDFSQNSVVDFSNVTEVIGLGCVPVFG